MVNKIKIFSKKKNKLSRNRVAKQKENCDYLFNEINQRLFERLNLIKRNNILFMLKKLDLDQILMIMI